MQKTQELLSEIVVYNKYAKYQPELKRRETWDEIIERYLNMMRKKYPDLEDQITLNGVFLKEKKVLPSMRALQFAGPAIEKNEARGYNCSYMPMEAYRAFDELMFLLLGGTGAGFSVQFHHVDQLPEIRKPLQSAKYLIGDSIEGWGEAVKQLMKSYFGITKVKPRFVYTDIRAKGERLITAGGKAPGHEPLETCLTKIETLLGSKTDGDKLTSFEVHRICCLIADAVLAGGIRRAALISLFSFDDEMMIGAKSSTIPTKLLSSSPITYTDHEGLKEDPFKMLITVSQRGYTYKDVEIRRSSAEFPYAELVSLKENGTLGWWVCTPELGRANNSATILRNRVKKDEFDNLWQMVVDSNSGEPGIYFTNDPEYGTNPCCEISLRPYTFCNLTEINAGNIGEDFNKSKHGIISKKEYKQLDFNERAEIAAFFGTLQAGFTDFHYLRPVWKKNTEKDSLVGVGITGICNGNILDLDLGEAAKVAMLSNSIIAEFIGIPEAARVTTIKPSGTTSCVVGTSSGIHAWHSEYYIRNMQCKIGDDLYNFFTKNHPELIKDMDFDPNSAVIGIPQQAPEGAILREDENAIQMMERVKRFNLDWVRVGHRRGPNTNNVSATVSVDKDEMYMFEDDGGSGLWQNEWDVVGEWMWDNKNTYNGLSVLPMDNGSYRDAPFEVVTKEVFDAKWKYIEENPIDLTKIVEEEDKTDLSGELACSSGSCDLTY